MNRWHKIPTKHKTNVHIYDEYHRYGACIGIWMDSSKSWPFKIVSQQIKRSQNQRGRCIGNSIWAISLLGARQQPFDYLFSPAGLCQCQGDGDWFNLLFGWVNVVIVLINNINRMYFGLRWMDGAPARRTPERLIAYNYAKWMVCCVFQTCLVRAAINLTDWEKALMRFWSRNAK